MQSYFLLHAIHQIALKPVVCKPGTLPEPAYRQLSPKLPLYIADTPSCVYSPSSHLRIFLRHQDMLVYISRTLRAYFKISTIGYFDRCFVIMDAGDCHLLHSSIVITVLGSPLLIVQSTFTRLVLSSVSTLALTNPSMINFGV